jgi:hypothetical protein
MSAFDLCDAREKRFLYDLMQAEPHLVHDHPIPELHALLLSLERMWGGTYKKSLPVSPELMYYLVIYAMHGHLIHEAPEEWRRGSAHEVHAILKGYMKSITLAIQDGSFVKHKNGEVYIDLFRIPQWFYDEMANDPSML